MPNLFAGIPTRLTDELIETLAQGAGVRIERIVSLGHTTPVREWYDQDQSEWVLLLRGETTLRFDDGEIELRPGDCINLPAHKRHRVERTSTTEPTIWLAVHYETAATAANSIV